MFKAIIDWFMVNYETYLLVGIGFALLYYYGVKRKVASSYGVLYTNKWFPILTVLRIPFYPVFIVLWLLNKLASWE